jgi:hypothetical protein
MSVSSFFHKVSNFVHGAAVHVSEVFVQLFGEQVSKQFANDALGVLKSELGKIVVTVVEALEAQNPNLPGDQKRLMALQQVGVEAKAAGIDASKQIVGMLIEIAVAGLKGQFGAA